MSIKLIREAVFKLCGRYPSAKWAADAAADWGNQDALVFADWLRAYLDRHPLV